MNDGMITATILHWGEVGLKGLTLPSIHCDDLPIHLPMSFPYPHQPL